MLYMCGGGQVVGIGHGVDGGLSQVPKRRFVTEGSAERAWGVRVRVCVTVALNRLTLVSCSWRALGLEVVWAR